MKEEGATQKTGRLSSKRVSTPMGSMWSAYWITEKTGGLAIATRHLVSQIIWKKKKKATLISLL